MKLQPQRPLGILLSLLAASCAARARVASHVRSSSPRHAPRVQLTLARGGLDAGSPSAPEPPPIHGLLSHAEFRNGRAQHAAIRAFVAQLPRAMQRPLDDEVYAPSVVLRGQFGQEIVRGLRPYASSLESFYASQQAEFNPFRTRLTGWSYALEPGRVRAAWRATLTASMPQSLFPLSASPEPAPTELAGTMLFEFGESGLLEAHTVRLTSFGGREIAPELLDELGEWLGWILPLGSGSGAGAGTGGASPGPRLPPNPARLLQLLSDAARSQMQPPGPSARPRSAALPASSGAARRAPQPTGARLALSAPTSVAPRPDGIPIPGSDDWEQYAALHELAVRLVGSFAERAEPPGPAPAQGAGADCGARGAARAGGAADPGLGDARTAGSGSGGAVSALLRARAAQAATQAGVPAPVAAASGLNGAQRAAGAARAAIGGANVGSERGSDGASDGEAPLRWESVATVDVAVRGERGAILAAGVRNFGDLLQTAAELRARIAPACAQEAAEEEEADEEGESTWVEEEGAGGSAVARGGEPRAGGSGAGAAADAAQGAARDAAPRGPEGPPQQPRAAGSAASARAADDGADGSSARGARAAQAGRLTVSSARMQWDASQRCARAQRPGEAATHTLAFSLAYEVQLFPLPPLPARTVRLGATATVGLRVESPPTATPEVCAVTVSALTLNGAVMQPAVLPQLIPPLRAMLLTDRPLTDRPPTDGPPTDRRSGPSADPEAAAADAGRLVAAVLAILLDGCALSGQEDAGDYDGADAPGAARALGSTAALGRPAAGGAAGAEAGSAAARAFATARSLQADLVGYGESLSAGARYEPALGALQADVALTGLLGERVASSMSQLRAVLRAARVGASVVRQQSDALATLTGGGMDELEAGSAPDDNGSLAARGRGSALPAGGGAGSRDGREAPRRGGAGAGNLAAGGGSSPGGGSAASPAPRTPGAAALASASSQVASGAAAAAAAAAASTALARAAGSGSTGRASSCVIEELSEERLRFGWALRFPALGGAMRLRVRLDCELSPESGLVHAIALSDARLNGAPLLPDAARELGGWLQEWQRGGTDGAAGGSSSQAAEQLAARFFEMVEQITRGAQSQ